MPINVHTAELSFKDPNSRFHSGEITGGLWYEDCFVHLVVIQNEQFNCPCRAVKQLSLPRFGHANF